MSTFAGKNVSGALHKDHNTGKWIAHVSYGIGQHSKPFDTEKEAMQWLESYGVFQK